MSDVEKEEEQANAEAAADFAAQDRADDLRSAEAIEANARRWLAALTKFVAAAGPLSGDGEGEARENALRATYQRIARLAESDLPGTP